MQHRHMTRVALSMANVLDALKEVVLWEGEQNLDKVLNCVRDTDQLIVNQVKETMGTIFPEEKEGAANGGGGGGRHGRPLELEVAILLYMGICISQQLKILCRAVAQAHLSWNEKAVAAAKELETEELEIGPHQGPEYAMALMLEGNYQTSGSLDDVLEAITVHSSRVLASPLGSLDEERDGEAAAAAAVEEGSEGNGDGKAGKVVEMTGKMARPDPNIL